MKKKLIALAMALVMVLGMAAVAAGGSKTISVVPMKMTVNGQAVTPLKSDGTPAEVFAYDGATYVPLRYVSQLLGIQTEWDQNDPNTARLVNVPNFTAGAGLKPGTYEVSIYGHNATIVMKITTTADSIANIEIVDHAETPGIGDTAFALIPIILETQNINVDAVSGATVTSTAIISGVTEAIRIAGGTPGDFMKAPADDGTPGQSIEKAADVVVIGSGAAGLSAALEARRAGSSVILMEKLPHAGGNTYICGGYIYGTGSKTQADRGLTGDSVDALVKYWMDRAEGHADEKLVRFVAEHSAETIDWVVSNGVQLRDGMVATGTSPVTRGLLTTTGGVGFVTPLLDKAQAEGIEVLLNTTATELITDNGAVCGVKAFSGKNTLTVAAKAVVLACGGFDADPTVAMEYSPQLASVTSHSSPGNTGDGIRMAAAIGADTVFQGGVIGFRSVPGVTYRDPVNTLRAANCLSVTDKGVRYTNETIDYPIFYANMKAAGAELFFNVFDSTTPNENLEKAVTAGAAFKADTIEALAQAAGIPADALVSSVDRYNELCAKGSDDDFGKAGEKMAALKTAPYYAVKVVPATIGSLGGVKIDLDTQVLTKSGAPISGLYAAGAVANGDFFYQTYPASGSAIQYAFTTGRLAGQKAAAFVK